MTELSNAMSEEDRVMVITKFILNAIKWLLEFIGRSKSQYLMQMVFGGSTMSSVKLTTVQMTRLLW
jgi:hypothetical protein